MREGWYRLDSSGDTRIGDLDAFVGTFTGKPTDAGAPRARVAYIDYGGTIYVFGGLTGADTYD